MWTYGARIAATGLASIPGYVFEFSEAEVSVVRRVRQGSACLAWDLAEVVCHRGLRVIACQRVLGDGAGTPNTGGKQKKQVNGWSSVFSLFYNNKLSWDARASIPSCHSLGFSAGSRWVTPWVTAVEGAFEFVDKGSASGMQGEWVAAGPLALQGAPLESVEGEKLTEHGEGRGLLVGPRERSGLVLEAEEAIALRELRFCQGSAEHRVEVDRAALLLLRRLAQAARRRGNATVRSRRPSRSPRLEVARQPWPIAAR